MHSVLVLGGGFILLAMLVLGGRAFGLSRSVGALAFVPIWFVVAAGNMWVGVTHAGYTVEQEFPIFLGIFGLPAAVALMVWWRLSAPRSGENRRGD